MAKKKVVQTGLELKALPVSDQGMSNEEFRNRIAELQKQREQQEVLDRLAEKSVAKRRALPRRPPSPFATQGLLDPIPEKQEPTAFMHLLDVPKTRT
jgi:hypothetical protein